MIDYFPSGLLGLMLASFVAAYMSTIDTQLNWGAGYLINDFYKRFIVKNASEKHYVTMSVIVTVFIALCGAGMTLFYGFYFRCMVFINSNKRGYWCCIFT